MGKPGDLTGIELNSYDEATPRKKGKNMDFVEALKTWASMPVKKMIVTFFLVLVVGAGYMYDKVGNKIKWESPLEVTRPFLLNELKETPFDYVGIFEYQYRVPFEVTEIQKACSTSMEICYRSKNYYLHQDLYRAKYHMQNLCEIHRFPDGDNRYDMKVLGTCPIIVDKQLKGYVMVTSMLNADGKDMLKFLRSTADKIAAK